MDQGRQLYLLLSKMTKMIWLREIKCQRQLSGMAQRGPKTAYGAARLVYYYSSISWCMHLPPTPSKNLLSHFRGPPSGTGNGQHSKSAKMELWKWSVLSCAFEVLMNNVTPEPIYIYIYSYRCHRLAEHPIEHSSSQKNRSKQSPIPHPSAQP